MLARGPAGGGAIGPWGRGEPPGHQGCASRGAVPSPGREVGLSALPELGQRGLGAGLGRWGRPVGGRWSLAPAGGGGGLC